MYNVQITKEFEDKQSLLNFVSAMLAGRGLYFTPKPEGEGWLLTYDVMSTIVDGEVLHSEILPEQE